MGQVLHLDRGWGSKSSNRSLPDKFIEFCSMQSLTVEVRAEDKNCIDEEGSTLEQTPESSQANRFRLEERLLFMEE